MDTARTIIAAFSNANGGQGARLDVTSVSSSVQVPPGGTPPEVADVLMVTNYGSAPAFIKLGKSDVAATLSCQCVLAGTQVPFAVPYSGQTELFAAAICESGQTTKLQMTRGWGN